MRYRDSRLHNAPVFAESGEQIGRLAGLIIDAESHEVIQYVVKKSASLKRLLPKELLVNRSQVVLISEEKIVIKDAAVTEGAEEGVVNTIPAETVVKPAGVQSTTAK